MKHKLLGFVLCSVLAFDTHAYVVGGASSSLTTASGNWSWDASYLSGFRSALENPAFFGPTGVVEQTITTKTLDSINATTLTTVDMFIAPWISDSNALAFSDDVIDFFLNGGDLFLLQDDSGHDYIGDQLGLATSASSGTVSNGGFPFFDGPFGTASDVTQHYLTGRLDPLAITAKNGTVVGTNQQGEVTSAYWGRGEYMSGAGALFIIADVDMIASTPPNGAIYGSELSDLNSNAIYALNTFSFLKDGESVEDGPVNSVPEPATLLLLTIGLAGIGLNRRSRRV